MGIRFRCHHCEHELHVKDFQGGKRGRCPECQGRFRIPPSDAEHSLALELEDESFSSAPDERENAHLEHAAQSAPAGRDNAKNTGGRQPRSSSTTAASSPPAQKTKTAANQSPPSSAEPARPRAAADAGKLAQPGKPSHRQQPKNAPSSRSADGQPDPDASPEAGQVAGPPPSQVGMLPRAVTDFPSSIWHVRPSAGGQYGPAPADVFTQWLIEGRVDQQAWVWRDDWQDWQQAAFVFAEYFHASIPLPSTSTLPSPPPLTATAAGTSGQPPQSTSVASNATSPPTAPLAVGDAANPRRDRRRRQRQRNIVIVSVLVVLFIGLLVTLGVVLYTQGGG